ncbi:hypothetical protein [Phycicoccus sp. Soil748]|uniref:hypothetical protein n=1 Tax=Phycicoccus sp. Soil748 TaxID=1736397 RepID=UPI00070388B6|nr:hypothetical protein [Phycicoccus sp. Soil748]KRE57166.1 hypothetical protein ASG70_01685 [Phycicoccus sp. Soil748]
MTSHARGIRPRWSRQFGRVVEALPDGLLAVTACAALLGAVTDWAGLRPLSSSGASRVVVLLLVAVGCATVGVGRGDRRTGASVLPSLPGLVLGAYAIGLRFRSPGDRAEWFLGGDHVRHLIFVAEEQVQGNLDYGSQPYPHAWHTVVTAIWSASGARIDAAGLRSLVDIMSMAAWCLPAVLSIATGSLTVAFAQRCGASRAQADAAGLGAGAVILLPPFLGFYQASGFENSYIGAIVLAVVAREVLTVGDRRRGSAIALTLVGTVVCAHSWQLLLPACGAAVVHVAWPVVRNGSLSGRCGLALGSVVCIVAAMPALLALFTTIGIQHATDSGVEAPFPVALLVVGLGAAVALTLRHRRDRALSTLLVIAVLPALTAIFVALWVGIPLSNYYPSKLFWHSAVLTLSPLAVLAVMVWGWSRTRDSSRALQACRGVAGALATLVLVYALVSPVAAYVGAWSTVRGPLVLDAITAPRAGEAQVVWLGTIGDDTIGRILLDFYRVPATRDRTPQKPLDVADECEVLRAAPRPTVLSDRNPADVRRRYACVPDITVIRSESRR